MTHSDDGRGRASSGHAFGVDIWSRVDQSGNAANAVQRNVALEGLQTHVALATADMTALPFDGGAFDVVVSSIAIHNIK